MPTSDRDAAILDAAERLLRTSGEAGFSMRDLAAAAGLSFATPFNRFGSKPAIMQALSARRIDAMQARVAAGPQAACAATRVLDAVRIATDVLLEEPAVNRSLLGSLGSPTPQPGAVAERSRHLWAAAIGDADGLRPDSRSFARAVLPVQLAAGFRGCLSFWVAGEIADAALARRTEAMAASLLLGVVRPPARAALLARLAG